MVTVLKPRTPNIPLAEKFKHAVLCGNNPRTLKRIYDEIQKLA
jgi:hypothetical protein